MKGFVCSVCGFVSIDGSAPENCPVCFAPKTAFQEKDAINEPKDPKNLTELEKKHVPVVKLVKKCGLVPEGCIDANVRIGETLHPTLPEHFIVHMDFYVDKKFVSRAILKPEKVNPAVGVHLKVQSGKLTVVGFCNLHGNWITEVDL